MSAEKNGDLCTQLLKKLTTDEHLSDAEKAHVVDCEGCMAALVKRIDRTILVQSPFPAGSSGVDDSDVDRDRPEAKQALEHGKRVFAREFGISLASERQR